MILLVGEFGDELGASHYLKIVHGRKEGPPPRLDFVREQALQAAIRALIKIGFVESAHDCSEGGLAIALVESCLSGPEPLGAEVDFATGLRADVLIFNETQSRIVISVKKQNASVALALLEWRGVPARRFWDSYQVRLARISADGKTFGWSLTDLDAAWPKRLKSSCARRFSMKNHIVAALLLSLSCLSAADPTTTAARAVNDLALDSSLTPPKPRRTQPFPPTRFNSPL